MLYYYFTRLRFFSIIKLGLSSFVFANQAFLYSQVITVKVRSAVNYKSMQL